MRLLTVDDSKSLCHLEVAVGLHEFDKSPGDKIDSGGAKFTDSMQYVGCQYGVRHQLLLVPWHECVRKAREGNFAFLNSTTPKEAASLL